MLGIWIACAALVSLFKAHTGWHPEDPDDFMRMLEVRDLLAGQSWYDVRQYRMAPPPGADMHWSRLVDLPIAAFRALFGLAMPAAAAEASAMIAVPLGYLLAAQVLLADILRRLELSRPAILGGVALVPLFPLLTSNFAPFRIDHHTPQGVAALACAALLLRAPSSRAALAAGAAAAVWLAISLESLLLVGAVAAIYGLRYALANDRSLAWFLGGLTGAAPLLSVATRPWSEFTGAACDVLHVGHVAAFAAGTVLAALLPFMPLQRSIQGRLAALALLPLACIPIVLGTIGQCAFDPFGTLDPVVRIWWFDFVLEGVAVWRQFPSVAIMLIWTVLLVVAGWLIARRDMSGARLERWTMLTLLALAACGYSLLVMRAGLVAQLLCIPFSALLLQRFLPGARRVRSALSRIAATIACLLLATPAGVSALAKPFDRLAPPDHRLTKAGRFVTRGTCDYTKLATLPPALLFAPLDRGPEIVMRTRHSVVVSGYHRNTARMADVIEAYSGDLRDAERRVRESGAQLLLICSSSFDLAMYRTRRPDNLVSVLAKNQVPDWLDPVAEFREGPLHLYRVK